jgi:hypothetical protein
MLGRAVQKHLVEAGFDSITIGRDNSEIKFQVGKQPIETLNISDFDYENADNRVNPDVMKEVQEMIDEGASQRHGSELTSKKNNK